MFLVTVLLAAWIFILFKGLRQSEPEAEELRKEYQRMRGSEVTVNEAADRNVRKIEQAHAQQIKEAEEQVALARKKQAEAERTLMEGYIYRILPTPSPEELEAFKRSSHSYDPMIHFAIVGTSGSGKSSLINAIRGIANNAKHGPKVAATSIGITETTRVIGRYPMSDVRPRSRMVFHDIPGAGSLEPGWVYFKAQELNIFDVIIIVFDNRFTETDIGILRFCNQLNIPAFVVRSKSDIHISNFMAYHSDNDVQFARAQYEKQTRASFADKLAQAGLHRDIDIYLVSSCVLLSVVNEQDLGSGQILIDEYAFRRRLSNYIPDRLMFGTSPHYHWRDYGVSDANQESFEGYRGPNEGE
jgi:GTP-binding protein EngB required for normal cell division